MSPDNPFADLIARPQVGGISADNPFADLIAKSEPNSAEPASLSWGRSVPIFIRSIEYFSPLEKRPQE
jgi:hypothetical protein